MDDAREPVAPASDAAARGSRRRERTRTQLLDAAELLMSQRAPQEIRVEDVTTKTTRRVTDVLIQTSTDRCCARGPGLSDRRTRVDTQTYRGSVRRHERDAGFTLIELLVVVVILGILVGIAIPVFLNYRKGAYEATAKSDLRLIQVEQRKYEVERGGFATTRQLATANPALKLSPGSVAAVVWSSATGFCVGATNTKAPKDSSAPFAAYGFPYKTFFFDSTTGQLSTTLCPTPSGATALDGSYLDDSGVH